MKNQLNAALLCVALAAPFACAQASAETVEEFYKGRPLKLTVGSAPASGFTLYARVLSRHMPQHIPGQPAIVIENLL